jgi:hypothetical protein
MGAAPKFKENFCEAELSKPKTKWVTLQWLIWAQLLG